MKEPAPQAFVREYKDDVTKKIISRWHYNYAITKHGPILVEEFGLPPKERKPRTKKKVATD